MPRARRRCGRPDCDQLAPCPDHDRRESRHVRGYDSEHVARAARLRDQAEELGAPCDLCDRPIDYGLRTPHPFSFVAHHLTPDKRGTIAPAHRRCNERAGPPRPT